MKKMMNIRLAVQLLCVVLMVVGLFTYMGAVVLTITLFTFFGGAFYCGWVCPYGTLQDLFSRLGTFLGVRKKKMPIVIQKYLKYVRYLVFALVMLVTADFIMNLMRYDPRTNFMTLLEGHALTFVLLGVILSFALIGMVFDRPFCNYLCYEGGKIGLMSSFRFMTIKRNEATCVHCKKCDKACPMNIEVSTCGQLDSLQCINCFACTEACPVEQTLTYGKVTFDRGVKTRYGIVLSVLAVGLLSTFVYGAVTGDTFTNVKESDVVVVNESQTALTEVDMNALTADELAKVDMAKDLPDGVYSGTADGFRGPMIVEVTVERQMITAVVVVDNVDDAKWFNRANMSIPEDIIDEQSADISVVSGATYSSQGIIEAVKDALEK